MGKKSVVIMPQAQRILEQMDGDLLLIAKDDKLGRKLQDLELFTRKKAPGEGKI